MMMTMMAMMGGGIGRNHRTSQNHNRNDGKEKHAQLHGQNSFSNQPLESGRLLDAAYRRHPHRHQKFFSRNPQATQTGFLLFAGC